MIVRANTLIVPKYAYGWRRPSPSDNPFQNFTLPSGIRGLIDGIVAEVPAGTDIEPVYGSTGYVNDWDLNCVTVGRYRPPTYLRYLYDFGYNVKPDPSVGWGSVWARIEHDMILQSLSGDVFFPNMFDVGEEVIAPREFGTFCSCWIKSVGVDNTLHSFSMKIKVRTQRGCAVNITEYEAGADGIVTVGIKNANPFAVNALRISDNTYQVLAEGGLSLPAGEFDLIVKGTWASGAAMAALLFKMNIDVELPYGL